MLCISAAYAVIRMMRCLSVYLCLWRSWIMSKRIKIFSNTDSYHLLMTDAALIFNCSYSLQWPSYHGMRVWYASFEIIAHVPSRNTTFYLYCGVAILTNFYILLCSGLPSFNTVVHNSACIFARSWQNCRCRNPLVEYFNVLNISYWLQVLEYI